MTQFVKTRHILAVHNLRVSTEFYINVLGFQRDFGDESDGWSWLSRDGFAVGLGRCPESLPADALGDHSYFAYVTVTDVDALFIELAGRGAKTHASPVTKPWGMREFALTTPDGHRLTFGQEMR
jgi:catechol 2,3-dioxygenase-like lactoylglutathione lyase family enzyme